MPTVPIPLFTRSYRNTDETILTDDAAVQYNGFIDDIEGLTIRPGEVLAVNSIDRNDGLYMWPDKNKIVSVDNGKVRLRTVSGQLLSNPVSSGTVTFTPGNPVVFCNDSDRVFMAGGGAINYIDESGTLASITDPQAPTTVTHVAFLDGYILAITGTDGKFYWSDIPINTDWSALSFASAEGNPDVLQALYIVQRQIYLLGTVSTEIWENDGESPFSRIPGGLIEMGCGAKYSPIRYENSLLWVNHNREIVQFTGTDIKKLSARYDKEIQQFSTVSDCIGNLIKKDGQDYCIFQFPTANRTLVYNPILQDWSEWGTWDSLSGQWQCYDIRSSARDLNSGEVFVGKATAGVIACLDSDSRNDLSGPSTSNPMKFFRRTGWINNGTTKQKRLEQLRFLAKRGAAADGFTSPKLMLRYRNNGSTTWSNIHEIDLGQLGDTEHIIQINRQGIYRSRQFEISATDDVPIVLAQAEADITILR